MWCLLAGSFEVVLSLATLSNFVFPRSYQIHPIQRLLFVIGLRSVAVAVFGGLFGKNLVRLATIVVALLTGVFWVLTAIASSAV
jgi:hypothetical protein